MVGTIVLVLANAVAVGASVVVVEGSSVVVVASVVVGRVGKGGGTATVRRSPRRYRLFHQNLGNWCSEARFDLKLTF